MIKKIITTVLLAVYKVLALFNLQPAIFILISGLIVFLTGSFVTYPVLKTVFLIAIAFCWKMIYKKKPSPILMILISAGLGIIIYSV